MNRTANTYIGAQAALVWCKDVLMYSKLQLYVFFTAGGHETSCSNSLMYELVSLTA